jgi:hypothetical protein
VLILVPAMCLSWMEASLVAKENMHKSGRGGIVREVYFTDDGFAMGVSYCLAILKQTKKYNSLHWKKSVEHKLRTDEQELAAKQEIRYVISPSFCISSLTLIARIVRQKKRKRKHNKKRKQQRNDLPFWAFHLVAKQNNPKLKKKMKCNTKKKMKFIPCNYRADDWRDIALNSINCFIRWLVQKFSSNALTMSRKYVFSLKCNIF